MFIPGRGTGYPLPPSPSTLQPFLQGYGNIFLFLLFFFSSFFFFFNYYYYY